MLTDTVVIACRKTDADTRVDQSLANDLVQAVMEVSKNQAAVAVCAHVIKIDTQQYVSILDVGSDPANSGLR